MKLYVKHKWNLSCEEAVSLQKNLRGRIIAKNKLPKDIRIIAGIDVSYSKSSDSLFAVVVLLNWPNLEILKIYRLKEKAQFPYIPGLLSFRESPPVIKILKKIRNSPDILMFDGHGQAHPRGFGIASHIGVLFNIPSVGCAKKRLLGSYEEPKSKKGDSSPLYYNGKIIGTVLRTRDNIKPVFVSAGHMIGRDTAAEIVIKCTGRFRIPLPTRIAHIESNKFRKEQEFLENETVL